VDVVDVVNIDEVHGVGVDASEPTAAAKSEEPARRHSSSPGSARGGRVPSAQLWAGRIRASTRADSRACDSSE
jgi:hypothetical protein